MNNRFDNLVESNKEKNTNVVENKEQVNFSNDNIFIKSENKYYENKFYENKKKENTFFKNKDTSFSKKKDKYNSFNRRRAQNDKKEPKQKKIDIKNKTDFPPLQ
tara:strand:+ start:968 stop:1279 length:312 start_codon:yes stop_codon:yes gene_type:complete